MQQRQQQHQLRQHMAPSVKMAEGMIRLVIVMGMISIIALRLEVIEIVRDLGRDPARRPGGIEVVKLRPVVVIALCTVNMVMIATAEGAIMAAGVEQHEVVETVSASEAQTDSVGARVQPHTAAQNSHCQLLAPSGSSMNLRSAKVISKVSHVQVNISAS